MRDRIRGVATNLAFLEAVLRHPKFRRNEYTTRFIDETPELFASTKRKDTATKLLTYVADVTVNGHPETRGRSQPSSRLTSPEPPDFEVIEPKGRANVLSASARARFASGCGPNAVHS